MSAQGVFRINGYDYAPYVKAKTGISQKLEADLQSHDDGIEVTYPDLLEGIVTRLFYNTSIKSAIERFTEDGIMIDDVSFSLVSVKEDVLSDAISFG